MTCMLQFYTHLIEYESIIVELDQLDLSTEEKKHLAQLADSTIHSNILDVILAQLSEAERTEFLKQLQENDHRQIWHFLNERVDAVEEKIKKSAEDLKKELRKDIAEAKEKKKP